MFSTHILSDVELVCDRVAIVVGGQMRDLGPLDRLLSPRLIHTEIVLEFDGKKELRAIPPDEDVDAVIKQALAGGRHVVSVTPRRESLEDLFVREVESGDTGEGAGRMKKIGEASAGSRDASEAAVPPRMPGR
jgi:ABC-2 type transport system ATP-binding protein